MIEKLLESGIHIFGDLYEAAEDQLEAIPYDGEGISCEAIGEHCCTSYLVIALRHSLPRTLRGS
jgi:hypothetical protein